MKNFRRVILSFAWKTTDAEKAYPGYVFSWIFFKIRGPFISKFPVDRAINFNINI